MDGQWTAGPDFPEVEAILEACVVYLYETSETFLTGGRTKSDDEMVDGSWVYDWKSHPTTWRKKASMNIKRYSESMQVISRLNH